MSTSVRTPDTPIDCFRPRGGGLIGSLKTWWMGHLFRRVERAAIIQLNAMSDRELHDVGLTRSQIEWAVRREPDRPRIPYY